jgi:flagellin-like hook-associated protein FlgL
MAVTLSSPAQTALDSILSTGRDQQISQKRLSTGLKVADAVDGPAAYFTARGLRGRAEEFTGRYDNIQQGMKTLNTASKSLEGIEKLAQQMKGLADQALGTSDTTVRTRLKEDFNKLRNQINALVGDATYNGTNLINTGVSTDTFEVKMSERTASTLTVNKVDARVTALGLSAQTTWGATNTAITTARDNVDKALSKLRSYQTSFATSSGVLSTRAEFTQNMISTLKGGADQLTVADLDEEGAKLAALNTRGQLAQSVLGLAIQREQGILRLL